MSDQWTVLKQAALDAVKTRQAKGNHAVMTDTTATVYDDDGNELFVFDITDATRTPV